MVNNTDSRVSGAPLRSSILVVVLITLIFASAALTTFVEKAGNDLMVAVHDSDAKHLRQEAFSALEVTLAVLEDFRQADNGLHSQLEGWGSPLTWANWHPTEGRSVEVSFRDESSKVPLARADITTLTNTFTSWDMTPADAAKLADAICGWMQAGYVYQSSITPDYDQAQIPYAEPQRPMRAFSELAAIDGAKDVFFDADGLPNGYYWRFVDDFSLFSFPQPNINGSNSDILSSVGQYSDSQRQNLSDYLNGTGQYANLGQQYFQDTTTVAAIAGVGGNAAGFSTTISALQIRVTVREGKAVYKLQAVVAPQGGAKINTTAALNAVAAASTSAPTASTSVTSKAQPASTATTSAAAAAAAKSINYPFTILQLLEDDQIPQPPPPLPLPNT